MNTTAPSPRFHSHLAVYPGLLGCCLGLLAISTESAPAADATETPGSAAGGAPAEDLAPMIVRGEAEYEGVRQEPFLAPVAGIQVFSGKKASVIDLDALPKVQANNYRQALATTPGLLYSEETTPLVSLGYRGIGEPHRMQYLQVLKDGVPIHADPYGYPEAYYTPPLDVVDRMEFVRGGASLLHGAQPAGSLNYVTYRPRRDRAISGRTYHTFGTDDLYSTYTSVDGTSGPLGYLGYYNHRQADGFRAANSDYRLDGGHFKVVYDSSPGTTWVLALDAYEEQHGEPGNLSMARYLADRNQTTRPFDRFELRRYVPSLELGHEFNEDTRAEWRVWGGYYDRYSRRQRTSGPVFGEAPTGPNAGSNAIERQEFYSFGNDARVRHDYRLGDTSETLTGGLFFYRSDSPRTDKTGATPNAEDGTLVSASQRYVHAGAAFVENRFEFGKLSVTPGVRLETVAQDVEVRRPVGGGVVSSKDGTAVEPLYGLGLAYVLPRHTELYASVAKSYRPRVFTEAVVPATGAVVAGDIDPTLGWSYEIGYRGEATDWLTWDTSLFFVELDNKFGGTVAAGGVTQLRSVGGTINRGLDAAVELELGGALLALRGETDPDRAHRLSVLASMTWLDAELHGGPLDGRLPQYAPEISVRSGLIYRWKDRAKVAMLGTFVDGHFATDDEDPTRFIPAYLTWDLTTEFRVYRDNVSLVGGINNFFDEVYFARIRPDGIDPAYRRNFYAGIQLTF